MCGKVRKFSAPGAAAHVRKVRRGKVRPHPHVRSSSRSIGCTTILSLTLL